MKRVLIPLAEGFEELEAVTIIDILRRAGMNVLTVTLDREAVTGAHNITVKADGHIDQHKGDLFDAVILPGGMPGTTNLLGSTVLTKILKNHKSGGKVVGAICAAPWVLSEAGVLDDKTATCYPGLEEKFKDSVNWSKNRVVVDENVVTSKGPGTALEFALALVEKMLGRDKSEELCSAVVGLKIS